VAFIDEQQRITRQVVEQARWWLSGRAAREVARVVLDARAVTDLLDHLHVEAGSLFEALRLEQPPRIAQLLETYAQVLADLIHRTDQPLARRDVVSPGVDGEARYLARDRAGQRVEERDRIDGVVEKLDAHGLALRLGREDVDHVAAHPISALREIKLVARVLHLGQASQQLTLLQAVAAFQVQHHRQVRLRIAEPVDRGDGRDDDRVRPLEQRFGRREAHLLDVLVHRGILLDVGVR
jgi:hypothetical protein